MYYAISLPVFWAVPTDWNGSIVLGNALGFVDVEFRIEGRQKA
jgi:hypothetical protein